MPERTAERRTLPADGRDADRRVERDEAAPERGVEVREPDRGRGALASALIPELALLAGAVYVFVKAGSFTSSQHAGQLGPAFWPRIAAVGLGVALLVRIVQTIREHRLPVVRKVGEFDDIGVESGKVNWRTAAIGMGLAAGYVLATMFLGYMFATIVFLAAFIWFGGQRTWYGPIVAIAGGLVMTYVFVGVVYVSVPTGVGVFDTVTVAVYELLGIQ
jgi:hypothetical protein